MEGNPKLKAAKEEIRAILEKYDIGALVALHTPGFGETLWHLKPSYSCVEFSADKKNLHLPLALSHYNGDRQLRQQKITDTVNMISLLGDMTGMISLGLMNAYDDLKNKFGIDDTGTTFIPDDIQ